MTAAPLKRAIEAQVSAIELASILGNRSEVTRREASLTELRRQQRRGEVWNSETAARYAEAVHSLDPKDGLRRLITRGDSGIGLAHLHTAFVMRDHVSGATSTVAEIVERVDGGKIHNGQMEALMDRRRPLRYAVNAAMDAVADRALMPVAMEIILFERSPRGACDRVGVTWGGQMPARICKAVVEALDAAAAHIGVAR